ncbi:MAG: hypothetical protein HYS07_05575 [Chlamydiae bacterium]|nr:hypothetical protein [Chlamydiota bacterium]MBI3276452.1 hypothetical protein [Chlamydiota bacterium]
MTIARTDIFKKDFLALPPEVQKATAKQIAQLLIDHFHPSLNLEGIKGHQGLFSARVNQRYRISLSFQGSDTLLLRRVFDHDDLYWRP